ncbi:MAG: GyrI-like domain-containing protein [Anaerocolumna sp.]
MKIERCLKETFVVIGKEGSTNDGEGFIKKLWENANSSFNEISHLAKRDANGNILGIWGTMSDSSHSFNPWQNDFSQGLYLAGVECNDNSEAPEGWTKWIIPGYEYLYAENEGNDTFSDVLRYMKENSISLSGAVHDFNCPETGKGYIFFPIRRL